MYVRHACSMVHVDNVRLVATDFSLIVLWLEPD